MHEFKQQPRFCTPQEYLSLERGAEFRHEYVNGEIFEMAGTNKRHNQISLNLLRLIGNEILDRECRVYGTDMRVRIPTSDLYTYPDVVGLCGHEEYEDDTEDTLLNPSLVIEVLSKSTEAYDRGEKFEFYQTIETLLEYVLITQEPFRVEQFVRNDANSWTYFEFRSHDDSVKLFSMECELTLRDIYFRVEQKFPKAIV